MTAAPYRVVDADHWAFEGTGLEGRRPVRPAEPARAESRRRSGHETDKISPSSPTERRAAGQGTEPRRRRGRHGHLRNAQRRRRSSRSARSAGRPACWSTSVSRITANVLRRFLAINCDDCPGACLDRTVNAPTATPRRAAPSLSAGRPRRRTPTTTACWPFCARWPSCSISIGCVSARGLPRIHEDLGLDNAADRLCPGRVSDRLRPVRGSHRPLGRPVMVGGVLGAGLSCGGRCSPP